MFNKLSVSFTLLIGIRETMVISEERLKEIRASLSVVPETERRVKRLINGMEECREGQRRKIKELMCKI